MWYVICSFGPKSLWINYNDRRFSKKITKILRQSEILKYARTPGENGSLSPTGEQIQDCNPVISATDFTRAQISLSDSSFATFPLPSLPRLAILAFLFYPIPTAEHMHRLRSPLIGERKYDPKPCGLFFGALPFLFRPHLIGKSGPSSFAGCVLWLQTRCNQDDEPHFFRWTVTWNINKWTRN